MQNFTPPRPPTATRAPSSNANSYGYNINPSSAPPIQQNQPNSSNVRPSRESTRSSSFGFLRRSKSTDPPPPGGERRVSSGKMSRKQKAREKEEQARREREAAAIPRQPPRLPTHTPLPVINSFGGENARPDSVAIISGQAGRYNQQHIPIRPNMSAPYGTSPPAKIPVPPVPTTPGQPGYVDPYARTESMTHRSRYSYASSAVGSVNSPRRVRRRKDPTPFNVMVIGAKNSGKTSFINFLRTSLASKKQRPSDSPPRTSTTDTDFTSYYLETEVDGERMGVTIWDSLGLEKGIVDLQVRGMSAFIESKFEETFLEEQKVVRAPGVRDTHIHCVFLVLDPVRLDANVQAARQSVNGVPNSKPSAPSRILSGLDDNLDIQVLRNLQGKTTVIPVISKADTITTAHMTYLKRTVWDNLKQARLDPLEALDLDESEEESETLEELDEEEYEPVGRPTTSRSQQETPIDNLVDRSSDEDATAGDESLPPRPLRNAPSPKSSDKTHQRSASTMSAALSPSSNTSELPYLPLSIISPDIYDPDTIGRRFPWGVADPYNPTHCDFVRLKESVFSEWRDELREVSREKWYETWRTTRLNRKGGGLTPQRAVRTVSAGTDAARPPMMAGSNKGNLRASEMSGGDMSMQMSPSEIGVAATTATGSVDLSGVNVNRASPAYGRAGTAGYR
ncbi:MAG: hypothetical protein M1820_006368 [Bogoriella megaspora]|nr:MAG: hypothetical protein M1820_006368 [Bogoriella megaspora]